MNEILKKYCKNYNLIVSCEFLDDDLFSKKLIEYYKIAVNRVNNDEVSLNKLAKIDKVMRKYIDDYNFSKKFRNSIDIPSMLKSTTDLTDIVLNYAVNFSDKYDNELDEPIINTRWI